MSASRRKRAGDPTTEPPPVTRSTRQTRAQIKQEYNQDRLDLHHPPPPVPLQVKPEPSGSVEHGSEPVVEAPVVSADGATAGLSLEEQDALLAAELERERQEMLGESEPTSPAATQQHSDVPQDYEEDESEDDEAIDAAEEEEEEEDNSEDEWRPPEEQSSRKSRTSKRKRGQHTYSEEEPTNAAEDPDEGESDGESSLEDDLQDDELPKSSANSSTANRSKRQKQTNGEGSHENEEQRSVEHDHEEDEFDEEAARIQAEVEAAAAWAEVRKRKEAGHTASSHPASAANPNGSAEASASASASASSASGSGPAPSLTAWLGRGPSAASSVAELSAALPMPTTCAEAQIVDRSSLFIGYVYPLTVVTSGYIATLLSHLTRVVHPTVPVNLLPPQFANAPANKRGSSHDMYAYRVLQLKRARTGLGGPDDFGLVEEKQDDGERWGGDRVLKVAREEGAADVLVVVSRWYGGELLGPVRFEHIENAARSALVRHIHLEEIDEFRQRIQHLDAKLDRLRRRNPPPSGATSSGSEYVPNGYAELDVAKGQRLWLARQKALEVLQRRIASSGLVAESRGEAAGVASRVEEAGDPDHDADGSADRTHPEPVESEVAADTATEAGESGTPDIQVGHAETPDPSLVPTVSRTVQTSEDPVPAPASVSDAVAEVTVKPEPLEPTLDPASPPTHTSLSNSDSAAALKPETPDTRDLLASAASLSRDDARQQRLTAIRVKREEDVTRTLSNPLGRDPGAAFTGQSVQVQVQVQGGVPSVSPSEHGSVRSRSRSRSRSASVGLDGWDEL
ncbi:hypothetical protein BCV70DRAFT_202269 [Testicularia cyperi]|uniref:Impact N-terminal domain-containing protein n=1 Tax=Testicularia cyperi TaxID=1882483 RepID=A0A317XJT1_9BASI|nr:hypothetical protein BCV70DRAFT_202269 [Testicularia cyperi]